MKIADIMTNDVCTVSPEQTIREAARIMAEADCGSVVVGENDRMIGMLTDRDIAIRAVANGRDCDTPVRTIMSDEVLYCFEDEDVQQVAMNMAENEVRRLPVVNRDKRLVGVVSLGNFATSGPDKATDKLVHGVTARH